MRGEQPSWRSTARANRAAKVPAAPAPHSLDSLEQRRLEQEAERAALAAPRGLRGVTTLTERDQQAAQFVSGIGQPLSPAQRWIYEQRYGHDLSGVRVHTDDAARRQADELGAKAYTVGQHIVFGGGDQLQSAAGQQRLGHELAHVAQQQQPGAGQAVQRDPDGRGIGSDPPSEHFVNMEGEIGAEDDYVLFPLDNADLDARDQSTIQRLVGQRSEPVTVHVHGYSSREGEPEYNLNLSAHRAVAVMRYLETLLPEGSRVVAYAHGETREFGGRPGNRRVGLDVLERGEPGTGAAETLTPSMELSGFNLGLDLTLELDLDFPPVSPPIAPPLPDFDERLWQVPNLTLPGTEFDPGAIAPLYSERGLPYSQRDARNYQDHFLQWRDRYILWGLDPETAAWLSQKGTEYAAGNQLSIEFPTRQEQLDRRMGTEPTIIPIFNDSMMRWLFERRWR